MKKLALWLMLSAFVLLALPWLVVTFVKGSGGMAVCFLLFFAVDPVYAICAGSRAGRDVKRLWPLPVITAGFFLLGAWLLFDMGEAAFLQYALVYLLLGLAAMWVSAFIRKKR